MRIVAKAVIGRIDGVSEYQIVRQDGTPIRPGDAISENDRLYVRPSDVEGPVRQTDEERIVAIRNALLESGDDYPPSDRDRLREIAKIIGLDMTEEGEIVTPDPVVHALKSSELVGSTYCGDGPESTVELDRITCPRCWRKLWERAVAALEKST